MGKNSSLLEKVELFEKLAAGPNPLDVMVKNLKGPMQAELSGGIRAINHLMATNPAAAKAESISILDDAFGQLGGQVSQLNGGIASYMVPKLFAIIGNASFYTSQGNAGTGYDPLTRTNGAYSPAAYLDRFTAYAKRLKDLVDKKPATTPQNPAPTNVA